MRVLFCRKTLVALTSTGLMTLQEKVLKPEDSGQVTFYGGSKAEPASFRYSNGSLASLAEHASHSQL